MVTVNLSAPAARGPLIQVALSQGRSIYVTAIQNGGSVGSPYQRNAKGVTYLERGNRDSEAKGPVIPTAPASGREHGQSDDEGPDDDGVVADARRFANSLAVGICGRENYP